MKTSTSHDHENRSAAQDGSARKAVVAYAPPSPVAGNDAAQLKSIEVGKKDKTTVEWVEGKLKGSDDTVGVGMLAKNLHSGNVDTGELVGSPPKGSAQKGLMAMLPTQPSLKTTDKYIKGHLLNHNIGGPGEDYNLFPITGSANSAHHKFVEKDVKKWVRDGKHVNYKVEVKSITDNSDAGAKKGTVNSTFSCLAENIEDKEVVSRDIVSTYNMKSIMFDTKAGGFNFDLDDDDNDFASDSWLGWIYDKIAQCNDQEEVDDKISLVSTALMKTLVNKFSEGNSVATDMIKEMFSTKAARFTARQQDAVKEIAIEAIYAYTVDNDKTEQANYESDYPSLIKLLKSKK